jgi:hypothetical protein
LFRSAAESGAIMIDGTANAIRIIQAEVANITTLGLEAMP